MRSEFNFGGEMRDFGHEMPRELIKTDYGQGCFFNGIAGHGTQCHHGGPHNQINQFQEGFRDNGMTFLFY